MFSGVVGPHYASSKSAVHGFVHWLAGNVAKKGITVNAIAPALIEETAMLPGGNDGLAKSKYSVKTKYSWSDILLILTSSQRYPLDASVDQKRLLRPLCG